MEAAIEYCRIAWDLFPTGKLIRFIASDSVPHILNNWNSSQQSISCIMSGLAQLGIPPSSRTANMPEHTVIHGLRTALSSFVECTDLQWERFKSFSANDDQKLINRCRVICITSTRDDESMKRLEDIFHNVLLQQNQLCQGGKRKADISLAIDHCHLVIINTYPVTIESQVSNHPPRHLSSILTTEVHSIKATLISNKLSSLILEHYDLASTTVTGIPMKEEQNASSSANYDVEIYHASSAHTSILKGNAADTAAIRTKKDGHEYETVTLKWCTPRSCSAAEMQNCTSMHRITPVDVNSRPSLCLINFLLNGRSVMLEMARKTGGKITSHLLAAHGGEIFVHTLSTARSVLEDPPSISEGCGGRVTDYRIPDFGLFIKQNRLFPLKPGNYKEIPTLKMKQRLARHTKYWPLTISSTLIFNLKAYIDPLPALITEEKITDEEVNRCKQVIYNLIGLESKHESLHLTNVGQKFKGQKREEQYKCVWKELETLIKNNLHTEQHRAIYTCLRECYKFNPDVSADRVELDQAIRELDYYENEGHQRATVIRATTDSPMSPPHSSASRNPTRAALGAKNLFDIFMASHSMAASKKSRLDFAGRREGGTIATLYANLKKDSERVTKGEGMVIE